MFPRLGRGLNSVSPSRLYNPKPQTPYRLDTGSRLKEPQLTSVVASLDKLAGRLRLGRLGCFMLLRLFRWGCFGCTQT